jgi:hypothetical protein
LKVNQIGAGVDKFRKERSTAEARLTKALSELETFLNAKKKPPTNPARAFLKEARSALQAD